MTLRALGVLALLAARLVAQESSPSESGPSIEKVVERANHQNPYYSAQGVKMLKARGAAALPALEEFVARRSVLALAPLAVEWLGEVPDERARALLRRALADAAFPWRPQAARALAKGARPADVEMFTTLARDPLPAVREAGLGALGDLAVRDPAARPPAIRALEAGLGDSIFEPRLASAERLHALGEKSALPILVEALGAERRFFELDFGVIARRRAWDALKASVGGEVAYNPALGKARNADAIREIARRLGVPPARAQATPAAADVEDAVFGIEVRSCRAGDQWIRITSGGELVLGHYDLQRKKLDPKTASELLALVRGASAPESRPAPGAFFGRPGCDFEKWYLPDESALTQVTVGQEGRPALLRALYQAIGAALEDALGPAAAQEFAERTAPFGKPEEGED